MTDSDVKLILYTFTAGYYYLSKRTDFKIVKIEKDNTYSNNSLVVTVKTEKQLPNMYYRSPNVAGWSYDAIHSYLIKANIPPIPIEVWDRFQEYNLTSWSDKQKQAALTALNAELPK